MSDAIIFSIGCLVSLLVMGAVGLLMWGAANEPAPGEAPSNAADEGGSRSDSFMSKRVLSPGLESKSPA